MRKLFLLVGRTREMDEDACKCGGMYAHKVCMCMGVVHVCACDIVYMYV